jgi:hypothetical protein
LKTRKLSIETEIISKSANDFFYKLVSTVISEGWRDASFGKSAAFEEEIQNIYKYYPYLR